MAVAPESSSNLYEATSPAPGSPLASVPISAADRVWPYIWKSSTVALRNGSAYCDRPIQFWSVVPRLAGCSVMFGFVATGLPSR